LSVVDIRVQVMRGWEIACAWSCDPIGRGIYGLAGVAIVADSAKACGNI